MDDRIKLFDCPLVKCILCIQLMDSRMNSRSKLLDCPLVYMFN